jgi:predicted XRE-type DNA-binding protein
MIKHGTMARGEKQHLSVLTENDVKAIRRHYKHGNVTQKVLAKIFGVTRSNISQLINGKSWNWLT